MSKTKTREEIETQIANEKVRLEKLQKMLKAKEKAEKEKADRARTHRLIEVGAIVESICGEITNKDAFRDYIRQYDYAIRRTQEEPTPTPSVAPRVTEDGGSDGGTTSYYM